MANKYQELQAEHEALLGEYEKETDPQELLGKVQDYIERAKAGAEEIPSIRDRSQVRANLRFWAAYVFDHSGKYPDTTLRPARTPEAAPPLGAPRIPAWLYLAGGLALVVIFVLVGWLLSDRRPGGAATEAPTSSEAGRLTATALAFISEQTPVEQAPTPSVAAVLASPTGAAATNTPLPSPTRGPTSTLYPTPAPVVKTAIVMATQSAQSMATEAAATAVSLPTTTPVPEDPDEDGLATQLEWRMGTDPNNPDTDGDGLLDGIEVYVLGTDPLVYDYDSAPPLLPSTGGGDGEGALEDPGTDTLYLRSQVAASVPAAACASRMLAVKIDQAEMLARAGLRQVEISLSRAGDGREVIRQNQPLGQALEITLEAPESDQAYLLQLDFPQTAVLFDTVIIQYKADCSRNQTVVTFLPNIADEALVASLLKTPAAPSSLGLAWRLITWGPSPFSGEWVAELQLTGVGGDGYYIFWAQGEAVVTNDGTAPPEGDTQSRPMVGDRLYVRQMGCKLANVQVGASSAGLSVQRRIWLRSANCLD